MGMICTTGLLSTRKRPGLITHVSRPELPTVPPTPPHSTPIPAPESTSPAPESTPFAGLPTVPVGASPTPPNRAYDSRRDQSPSLVLLVIIATLGILAYAGFLLDPASRGDWLPYAMVITA